MTSDARRFAPAAARNRDVILKTLRQHLPERGHVLEIASGSGEHINYFATAHPGLKFQPSDPDPDCRASIDAWTHHHGLTNVAPAITLDTTQNFSTTNGINIVICINMIHIAPWSATVGLMHNTASLLPTGGLLFLYGPFRRRGAHTAPTNEAFDFNLRAQNPDWGIRDLEAITTLAKDHGFSMLKLEAMPANNFSVVFKRC